MADIIRLINSINEIIMKHKSAPEILADKIGVLKIDGVKWDRVSGATNKILSAMEDYRSQSKEVDELPSEEEIKEFSQMIYLGRQSICKEQCHCHAECNKADDLSKKFEKFINDLKGTSAIIAKKDVEIKGLKTNFNISETIRQQHESLLSEIARECNQQNEEIKALKAEKEELRKDRDDWRDESKRLEIIAQKFNEEKLKLQSEISTLRKDLRDQKQLWIDSESANRELRKENERLKDLAHRGLPGSCVLNYNEVKFCPHRQGEGNICKECSNYKD